jgi:hypothetical protein
LASDFQVVEVEDEGLLPLVARISEDPPRFLLKSGRVGGPPEKRGSLEITDEARAAALAAARASGAEWERDPDLGVDLLVSGAEGVPEGLLVPRFLYRGADRVYEYAAEIPGLRRRMAKLARS